MNALDGVMAEFRCTPDYEAEVLLIDIQETCWLVMREHGITRKELARRLGCHPAQVTRFFQGTGMMRLRTIVAVALALGLKPQMTLAVIENAAVSIGEHV